MILHSVQGVGVPGSMFSWIRDSCGRSTELIQNGGNALKLKPFDEVNHLQHQVTSDGKRDMVYCGSMSGFMKTKSENECLLLLMIFFVAALLLKYHGLTDKASGWVKSSKSNQRLDQFWGACHVIAGATESWFRSAFACILG